MCGIELRCAELSCVALYICRVRRGLWKGAGGCACAREIFGGKVVGFIGWESVMGMLRCWMKVGVVSCCRER